MEELIITAQIQSCLLHAAQHHHTTQDFAKLTFFLSELYNRKGGQYRVQKYRGILLVPVPTVLFQKWYRSTGAAVLFLTLGLQ